jgi:acetoin utilization protein AcuB
MSSSDRPTPVSEVMTSSVHTAVPEQKLGEIWQILVEERCHHIPVVEDGRPVGMISTRDLIHVARDHGSRKLSDAIYGNQTAGEIMSADLETIDDVESVEVAIDRIGRGDIHALVVVDEDKRLAGIVTNHDLLDYLIS